MTKKLPEPGSEEASRLAKAAARAFVAFPELEQGPELDDAIETLALTTLAAELKAATVELGEE